MLERIDFELEVLSPVHIGSAEKITHWEYVIEGNRLKVYPYEHIVRSLLEKNPAMLSSLRALMQEPNFSLQRLFSQGLRLDGPAYELELRGRLQTREVELFIKSLGRPYIPGSELKGALRTAFIGGLLLRDEGLRKRVEEELRRADARWLDRYASKGGGFEELFLYPEDKKDAKYDLFKALSFADLFFEFEGLCLEVPSLMGSNRPLHACEAIKEGTKIRGSMTLDMRAIESSRTLEGLRYKKLELSWEELRRLSEDFYSLVIELEMEFFQNKPEIKRHLQRVKERAKEGILLRIGKHQGYLSTTVMAVFKRHNPQLFERVFELSVQTVRREKPKTKRLSSKGSTFGWVLLVK